ncbi:MAG: phytanoyl-CoA dioxygenase family protein, partial [Pseudomonadales bacterium]
MTLSDSELAAYRRDGYLVRERVFGEAELVKLRGAVENAVALASRQAKAGKAYCLDGKRFADVGNMTVQFEHQPGSDTLRVIEPVQHLNATLEALVRDDRVVEPVKSLLGTSAAAVWTNKLNLKRPQEGSGFGWHQDAPYWVHDCTHVGRLPNAYLAFDDAALNNGCLGIIRGSHLEGCLPGTDDG